MNLIPDTARETVPNYWCTWATQAFTITQKTFGEIAFQGDQGQFGTRDNLNSKTLFGPEAGRATGRRSAGTSSF